MLQYTFRSQVLRPLALGTVSVCYSSHLESETLGLQDLRVLQNFSSNLAYSSLLQHPTAFHSFVSLRSLPSLAISLIPLPSFFVWYCRTVELQLLLHSHHGLLTAQLLLPLGFCCLCHHHPSTVSATASLSLPAQQASLTERSLYKKKRPPNRNLLLDLMLQHQERQNGRVVSGNLPSEPELTAYIAPERDAWIPWFCLLVMVIKVCILD